MFESIIVRNHGLDHTALIDVGLLAETILMYNNVHVYSDQAVLYHLIREIGAQNLISLIENNRIKFTYIRRTMGVYTDNTSGNSVYSFAAFEVTGTPDGKNLSPSKNIARIFEEINGASNNTTKLVRKFLNLITIKLDVAYDVRNGISELSHSYIKDGEYLNASVRNVLSLLVPRYQLPEDFIFSYKQVYENKFQIETNLGYDKINDIYHQSINPDHSSITTPYLLTFIQGAAADLHLSSRNLAELLTTPISSNLCRVKIESILAKRETNEENIKKFEEIVVGGIGTLREAINSKERSFEDFLKLLDKADRFKGWLATRNPDADLIAEFYRSTTADSWVEKLPTKSVRFMIASGLGVLAEAVTPPGIGVGIGVTLGAIDGLLLDRLIRGWKPSHFVEKALLPFVNPKSN